MREGREGVEITILLLLVLLPVLELLLGSLCEDASTNGEGEAKSILPPLLLLLP